MDAVGISRGRFRKKGEKSSKNNTTVFVVPDLDDRDPLEGVTSTRSAIARLGLHEATGLTAGELYWCRYRSADLELCIPTIADAGRYEEWRPSDPTESTGKTWDWMTQSTCLSELVHENISWALAIDSELAWIRTFPEKGA